MRIIKNSLFFLAVLFLVISCDKKRVFDEYKSVGNTWSAKNAISFILPKMDASKKYNLFVNVRDNNDFPFNNLYLIVSMEQPDKKTVVDTLEYLMANPDGSLMGEGFSDIKENKLFYKDGFEFKLKGTYKVKIQQAVRQTGKVTGVKDLKGITEVGFRVESRD